MRLNQVLALLILCLAVLACSIGDSNAQSQYSIELQELTWDHSTISILLIPNEGASWWNPDVVNFTLKAVGVWNDAFTDFAAKYPNFTYTSNLKLAPTVSTEQSQGFDVYISWVESQVNNGSDQVGLTLSYPNGHGMFLKCDITLAAKNGLGLPLGDLELQNIAEHELGHALGLGHCNLTTDLMYPQTGLTFEVRRISTLDAYGVAAVFGWLSASSQFYSANKETPPPSVDLPSDVKYEYLTISKENLPPQSIFDPILNPVRRFLSTFFDFLLVPENLILFILIMFGLLFSMVLYRLLRPRKVQNQAPTTSFS
jgi:predicted Zn-dependent protease